ncbi:MAG TPA: hypothetical protein VF789_06370 [Thermoanaerobaculia bacterium]
MTKAALAELQRQETAGMLFYLAMLCRRRFLRSAYLVEMRSKVIDALRDLGQVERVDLSSLVPAWNVLCGRYLEEIYDPQGELFSAGSPQADDWSRFVYHKLLPQVVRDDELVRNVLRALGALPCNSPQEAAAVLCQYFGELTLPSERPPWAPEEELD